MRTILLIEDDTDLRLIFSLLLRFQGFTVTSAVSIAEGIQKLNSHPDFVICSVNRDELDLIESMVKLAKTHYHIPHFILFSSFV